MLDHLTRLRREEGFTLIELMIVMVVLGILAGIVLFAVGTFSADATTSKDKANDRICATASAAYAAKHDGALPPAYADISSYFAAGTTDPGCPAGTYAAPTTTTTAAP